MRPEDLPPAPTTRYPDARRISLTFADLRRLTLLERARACAIAEIGEEDLGPLLDAALHRRLTPEQNLLASTVFYAMAYELERRLDRSLTWAEAETWDVEVNLETGEDPVAEAEARTSVEASIATGLPPAVAGELTIAQLDAYSTIRKRAERRQHRARVHR